MALDNTFVYRPFGAALVYVGTGANNALEQVGYTVDGATVRQQYGHHKIMTDVNGPVFPGEVQEFGEGAAISIPFIVWHPTIWNKVLIRASNNTTAGTLGPAGTLMFTNGRTFRLALQSADSLEDPLYFPACYLPEGMDRKMGSVAHPMSVTVMANPFHLATTNSTSGTVA